MLHRTKKENDIHEGKWNGLGGKLIPGETPEECVTREINEESGLTIKNPTLKGILTFPGFSQDEDWYVYVFHATQFEGRLIESQEGHLEWVKDEKITELNLWEGDKFFLEWLKNDKFFSGKFVYKNGQLQDHQVIFYN